VRCRFVQLGDIHLGTQQYDCPERLNDFGRAWLFACEHVVRARPDFVVCTGDLFNRFTINPTTFDQAYAGLSLLREAGIPIVDVAGNHDRARFGEGKSWLETFADQGLLTVLDVDVGADGLSLRPVQGQQRRGSYIEWSGCRIIGLRYLGASTERILGMLEPELERLRDGAYTILVLHAGVEGVIPHFNAELPPAAIEQLRERVDYVALGHIHKHYTVSNLAYNAGSLETWALNEWSWPRGLLDVDVDTDRDPVIQFRLVDVPKRPFCVVRIDVNQYGTPNDLLRACWERIQIERERRTSERPVVFLTLHGRLRFDQTDLPINKLEEACRELLEPLVTQIREQYDLRDFVTEGGDDGEDPVDRAFLERAILQARLAEDERYATRAADLAKLAVDLKERALRDGDGHALLQVLRNGLQNVREMPVVAPAAVASANGVGGIDEDLPHPNPLSEREGNRAAPAEQKPSDSPPPRTGGGAGGEGLPGAPDPLPAEVAP
jgi:DNA repair protein SbcD/Mre11